MTLLLDTSALVAHVDRDHRHHTSVSSIIDEEQSGLVVSAFVAAEIDYLVLRRFGIDAELALLGDLAEGPFEVVGLTRDEMRAARDVVARYRDLELGLADASLVVLAKRFRTRRILTLDERDFRAIEPLQGGAFEVLPADA